MPTLIKWQETLSIILYIYTSGADPPDIHIYNIYSQVFIRGLIVRDVITH